MVSNHAVTCQSGVSIWGANGFQHKWLHFGGEDFSISSSTNSSLSSSQPRFERALARLRRRHEAPVRKQAQQILQESAALADDADHPKLTHHMKKWLDSADLEPVFQYLTS